MRKFNFILLALLLAVSVRNVSGYSLLGPLLPSPGGEPWEVIVIGHALPTDVGGVHNIGEEYRRNTPVLYYAYDANYFGFFGLVGATNTDAAFGIMNSLTNVSSYSAGLNEFPPNSQSFNPTAQAMYLYDLKSITLHIILEEMGLANPERYTWTLHDRLPGSGSPCQTTATYTVVQRNFDVLDTPFNQVQYSPYVNDVLYSYYIREFCSGPANLASTVPFAVDPLAEQYTSVAGNNLELGGFYTGLTKDDVAGLRYLMSSNNINFESTLGSGALLVVTNKPAPVLLTTLPFSLLFSQSITSDPDTLRTNFPGLVILSVITNIAPVATTNVTPYFTNQSVLPVFTGATNGLPRVTTLTNIYYFTNQPGPTVINYDFSQPFQTISTLDLALFSDRAATNDAPTMVGLYPGLLILKSTAFPSYIPVTNYISYLTNITGAPYQGAPMLVTKIQSINFAFVTNWVHQFGNVFTNHFYTNRTYRVRSVWITNLIGAPYGSPFVAYTNDVTKKKTNSISGDFFIFPTNWCGFDLRLALPSSTPPESFSQTNTYVYAGYNSDGSVGTNATVGGDAYGLTESFFYQFTNYSYAVNPGICEPVLQFGTNYSTNIITTYQYYFGNIVTNHFFTNTFTTILTTNIAPCLGGSPNQLCTNITITTFYDNQLSGDFFIPPPEWCGYLILSNLLTTTVSITNTISATNRSSPDVGQSFTQTTIKTFTNTTFLVQPSICSTVSPTPQLRQGIERLQYIRANYDSLVGQFFQPITNTYQLIVVTNGQRVLENYQRVVSQPDVLMSAQDFATIPADPGLGIGTTLTRSVPNWDTSEILPGLHGPGVINPRYTITYNKVGPIYLNGPLVDTNSFLYELNQSPSLLQWASFDGSTNTPVLYPNGTSIANLANSIFIQISPATVTNGVAGMPYKGGAGQTFTATGGQPPYIWAAPNLPNLVPGMNFNANTATLNGTPVAAGTYNFTIQVTDSVNRVVSINYSITIN